MNSLNELFDIKPRPCIGCGHCCVTATCEFGLRQFGNQHLDDKETCPALVWDGKRHICDYMVNERFTDALRERIKDTLHAGAGCCQGLNSWRREPLQDRTVKNVKKEFQSNIPPIMQKFIAALAGQFISGDCMAIILIQFKHMLENDGMPVDEVDNLVNEIKFKFSQGRSSMSEALMG